MQNSNFDLRHLLPHFSDLSNSNFTTAHSVSALVILFLWVIFLFFLIFALKKYTESRRNVKFYTLLLNGITQDHLAEQRRDIINTALKNKACGYLWREFDESLVYSADGKRLFNTLDAAHFFNTTTLSRGLTENRLLAAVPGFLTAVGVIGTFAGLQMGLATLELSQDAGVEVLQQGIGSMISGASIAFLTSVWGVFTSVLFNFTEKLLERGVRNRISKLQNMVDYLYPRINAEQSLVAIADHTRTSNDTLNCLAEKIGDRLQEALVNTTDSIRSGLEDSLNQIMGPAIKSLVDNANNSSQQILEELLTKFMDGVSKAGKDQGERLGELSDGVNDATKNLGGQMSEFIASLEKQQNTVAEEFKIIIAKLSSDFDSQQEKTNEQDQDRIDKLNSTIGGILDQLAQQQNSSDERDTKRNEEFEDNIGSFGKIQNDMMDQVQGLIVHQEEVFGKTYQQLNELAPQFKELARAHGQSASEVKSAAKQMQDVSNQLGILSVNIKEASEALASDIKNATDIANELSHGNLKISHEMKGNLLGYQQISKELSQVSKLLEQATKYADSGFHAVGEHFEKYREEIKGHIEELEGHLEQILAEYSNRVEGQTRDRLNVWNEQTNEYSTQMTNAVRVLQAVVDDIENKVGRNA